MPAPSQGVGAWPRSPISAAPRGPMPCGCWCRPWVCGEGLGRLSPAPGVRPARGRQQLLCRQRLLARHCPFAQAGTAARRGALCGDIAARANTSLSVSRKLLKAGRSLDAGPNSGRAGAWRTPRGGRPPLLASSSGAAHGEPWQPPRGDGPDLDRRVRPRRWAVALSQDYTQSCSLRTPALASS